MQRSAWYIIFIIVGLLVVWSYFRIQSEEQREDTNQTLLNNMSEILHDVDKGIDLINMVEERQQKGQDRLNLTINKMDSVLGNISVIVGEQERQRREANITTKGFVDDFNKLFAIIEEQERQRQEANITTSEFVDDFNELKQEVKEVFERLTSGVNRQDEIVGNQEKIISLFENSNMTNS